MSRNAAALLALSLAAPLSAQDVSAEQALDNYHTLTATRSRDCGRSTDPDEIVVCARDESAKLRLPLPRERGPRDGPRLANGEVPAGNHERMRAGICGTVITDTLCGGTVGIVSVSGDGASMAEAPLVLKALTKLLDPNAEVSRPPRLPDD